LLKFTASDRYDPPQWKSLPQHTGEGKRIPGRALQKINLSGKSHEVGKGEFPSTDPAP
jgi:hypothetical protein